MEERRNAFRVLVGNPEGKRPLGLLVTCSKFHAEDPHVHRALVCRPVCVPETAGVNKKKKKNHESKMTFLSEIMV
jgi:hypothetical protein